MADTYSHKGYFIQLMKYHLLLCSICRVCYTVSNFANHLYQHEQLSRERRREIMDSVDSIGLEWPPRMPEPGDPLFGGFPVYTGGLACSVCKQIFMRRQAFRAHRNACCRGQAQTCKYVALFSNKTQRFRIDDDETMFYKYPVADCVDSKTQATEPGFSGERKMRPKRKCCLSAISYAEDEVLATGDTKYELGTAEPLLAAAEIVEEVEMKVDEDLFDEQTLTFIASSAIELDCRPTYAYAFAQPATAQAYESARILPAAGTNLETAIVISD